MRYDFELKGKTALLMHADNIEWSDELDGWRKDKTNKNLSKAGDDRSPAWTWLGYLYHDGENVTVPAGMLMPCLRAAGSQHILKKQKTMKEITQSGMFIEGEYCDFLTGDKPVSYTAIAKKLMGNSEFSKHTTAAQQFGFKLDVRRARIGQSKHVRVRPRFDDWTVRGTLNVIAEQELTSDVVKSLFESAGRIGIGDWRPGCKTPGPYGQFEATVKGAK